MLFPSSHAKGAHNESERLQTRIGKFISHASEMRAVAVQHHVLQRVVNISVFKRVETFLLLPK